MARVFLPFAELFSVYMMHFLRTVLIVALNLTIARLLLSSEFFGDFRVAVKFLLILGGLLFFIYPFLERKVRNLGKGWRFVIYTAMVLGVTGLLNGGYILSRNFVHGWSIVDYFNHHPIHIMLMGTFIFIGLQLVMARANPGLIKLMHNLSYGIFGLILALGIFLLPELDLNTMVVLFLTSQLILLGIGWSVYRFGSEKKLEAHHVSPKVNLMHQTSLALSLFVLELLSGSEQDVTHFAIIMSIVSLMFVVTQPLSMALEDLKDWMPEYLSQVSQLIWVNALFSSCMFLLLMPLSRFLLGWIDGGLVLDLDANEPMLLPLRVSLVGFLIITWLRPFFSILMRHDAQLAQKLQMAKAGILLFVLLVLVPPYGLSGAIAAELTAAFCIYGYILFHLVEQKVIYLRDLADFQI